MDRKIKLAATASLLALTAVACAPNPYYAGYNNGANNQTVNRGTVGNRSTAGVTHTHCGRTHTHALPAEGLAHQHGDGCVAGAGGATTTGTNTSAYNYGNYNAPPQPQPQQPAANSYGYAAPAAATPYYDYSAGSTSSSTYTAPAATTSYNTGSNTGSYYDYSAPKTTAPAVSTYNSTPQPVVSASSASGFYTVQKGDTVFQVMRNTGVYWKDIIRLNNLAAPNYPITPGQRLTLK